jgi:hypothetical protein
MVVERQTHCTKDNINTSEDASPHYSVYIDAKGTGAKIATAEAECSRGYPYDPTSLLEIVGSTYKLIFRL